MEQKEQSTALAPMQDTYQPMIAIGNGVNVTLGQMMDLAATLAGSATLPKALSKPGDVVAAMLTAAELGLPVMATIRSMHMIDGKVTLSADMMLAAVRARGAVGSWSERGDDGYCEITASRRDDGTPLTIRHDDEDARREGLLSKGNWRTYPRAMHRAAAVRIICRALWPDILAGCYEPEELERPAKADRSEPRAVVNEATGEIVEQHAPARSDQRTVARVCAAFAEVRRSADVDDAATQLLAAHLAAMEALEDGRITPNGSGRKAVDEARMAAKAHYDRLREEASFQPEQPAEQPVVEEGADIAAARVVYKQFKTRIAATVEDSDPEDGLADLADLREEVLALADTPGWPADGKPLASLLKLCADAGRALEQRRAEGDVAPSDLEG